MVLLTAPDLDWGPHLPGICLPSFRVKLSSLSFSDICCSASSLSFVSLSCSQLADRFISLFFGVLIGFPNSENLGGFLKKQWNPVEYLTCVFLRENLT